MPDYEACELTLIFDDYTETVFTMLDMNACIESVVFDCWEKKGLKDFKWKIVGQEERLKKLQIKV